MSKRINHSGPIDERVDPEVVREALGAECSECRGFGVTLTVYDGKQPCPACTQQKAGVARCGNAFGSKVCVLELDHDGPHVSRSGSSWGIAGCHTLTGEPFRFLDPDEAERPACSVCGHDGETSEGIPGADWVACVDRDACNSRELLEAARRLCVEIRDWGRGRIWHYPPRMDADCSKPKDPAARGMVSALEELEARVGL